MVRHLPFHTEKMAEAIVQIHGNHTPTIMEGQLITHGRELALSKQDVGSFKSCYLLRKILTCLPGPFIRSSNKGSGLCPGRRGSCLALGRFEGFTMTETFYATARSGCDSGLQAGWDAKGKVPCKNIIKLKYQITATIGRFIWLSAFFALILYGLSIWCLILQF